MRFGDTIVALASPPGRSARAMIRVSGSGTSGLLAAVMTDPVRMPGAGVGRLRLGPGPLPVLLAIYAAPRSYTGEDSAEVLLPGNPLLVERVVARLLEFPGARAAEPGEFTARAYLNGKLSLDRAEGVAATIAAATDAQLAAARSLLEGSTGAAYRAWAEELATLLALVEAGIDFTDQEDVTPIAAGALRERLDALSTAIGAFLGSAHGGEARSELPRVVLAGEPNAGKSTLFNALLDRRRAVVSPIAGTTRDALEETLDLAGVLPGAGAVRLVDVAGMVRGNGPSPPPGLLPPGGGVDADARRRAADMVRRADALVYCDPTGRFAPLRVARNVPVIRVKTKADLPAAGRSAIASEEAIAVCALDGWNLGVLRRAIADAAWTPGEADLGAILPRHRRALSATIVRITAAATPVDGVRIADPAAVADSLRGALDAIGELVGRISPDDIIGRIFATFCVGK
ncbi:MAG: tRNA modification GTPase [Phycisphaerales bacterium]